MSVRTITKDGETYAKIFPADIETVDGVNFVTSDLDPLQVGVFDRDAGYEVAAHKHNPRQLELECPGEFILFQKGSAEVEILDEQWQVIETVTINAGDCLVVMKGGHRFTMLEPVRILEVKQGPYIGREQEKTFKPTT